MTDEETILNDWNPSAATLRAWAFDPLMFLAEQDEDLVLHKEHLLPLLLELAADPACPKAEYILSSLDCFLMFQILRKLPRAAPTVERAALMAANSSSPQLHGWSALLQRRLACLRGAGAVDSDKAMAMATDLLTGPCRSADITLSAQTPERWELELSIPPLHQHREFLSIDKDSGHFNFGR